MNPAAFGVVLGLGGVGLEYAVARWKGRASVFRFESTIANLACGLGSQAVALVLPPTTMLLYERVYAHGAPWHLPAAFAWPLGLLALDFLYYWTHRFSHEWSFLWGAHAVHHHSEDFNITVSIREPFIGLFMLAPFFLPLAVLGVPPAVYLVGVAMHVFFGYLEHTQFVGRLPRPFEWLFATPSNHRVHHAINPEYLDRNYGAILMIWDRIFGTYEPERAPCVFGVTKPLASLNPVWANVEHWHRIAHDATAAKGLRARLRLVFGPPARLTEKGARTRAGDAPPLSLAQKAWISVQLVVAAVVLGVVMFELDTMSAACRWGTAAFVLGSSTTLPALIERRRFAWPLEIARVAASGAFVLALL